MRPVFCSRFSVPRPAGQIADAVATVAAHRRQTGREPGRTSEPRQPVRVRVRGSEAVFALLLAGALVGLGGPLVLELLFGLSTWCRPWSGSGCLSVAPHRRPRPAGRASSGPRPGRFFVVPAGNHRVQWPGCRSGGSQPGGDAHRGGGDGAGTGAGHGSAARSGRGGHDRGAHGLPARPGAAAGALSAVVHCKRPGGARLPPGRRFHLPAGQRPAGLRGDGPSVAAAPGARPHRPDLAGRLPAPPCPPIR